MITNGLSAGPHESRSVPPLDLRVLNGRLCQPHGAVIHVSTNGRNAFCEHEPGAPYCDGRTLRAWLIGLNGSELDAQHSADDALSPVRATLPVVTSGNGTFSQNGNAETLSVTANGVAIREALAAAEGAPHPEPQPLPGGLPAVPALDERLLPDALRPWLVDIANRAQAPLDFPGAGAIVALSSALGRRRAIHPKRKDDWLVVPNLWGVVVAPPGCLKSPMLHEVQKPLARIEARAREDYKRLLDAHGLQEQIRGAERKKLQAQYSRAKAGISREELETQLRALEAEPPTRQRFIVNDPTVEKLGIILNENPNGVLLSRDEIAGFLATMDRDGHENDRSFYLEAWNGYGRYSYDRIQRGTLDIEAACVSILGAITPGPLSAYLREAFSGIQDDGLIQRFQISVYPDPPPPWRNVDRWPETAAKNRAFELFETFVSFGSDPSSTTEKEIPSLRFDEPAQDFFDGWHGYLEKRIRDPDEHEVMTAHIAKYRSLMPSLALIFHLCDSPADLPVSLEAAQRAAAWCDYLEPHARRIYYGVTARVASAVRLLGEKIRQRKLKNSFTSREVYRHQWTGLTDPDEVSRALEALEDLDWVESKLIPSDTTGRRPTTRYEINPRIWE